MTTLQPERKKRILTIIVLSVVVILLLWLYGSVDPESQEWGRFFPKCPVKLLTGLQCPSCGIQRATFALLHGDIPGALRQNWFIPFSLAYLAALILTKYLCKPFSTLQTFFWGRRGCTLYISLYIIWFILRNILGC